MTFLLTLPLWLLKVPITSDRLYVRIVSVEFDSRLIATVRQIELFVITRCQQSGRRRSFFSSSRSLHLRRQEERRLQEELHRREEELRHKEELFRQQQNELQRHRQEDMAWQVGTGWYGS